MGTDKIIHPELSQAIVGAAMKVLNTPKPGLNEKGYGNTLAIELGKHGHRVDRQKRFDVLYEGQVVDMLVPDLIVNDLVIADPKVAEDFTLSHVA
jgi:GxxExxY protein